MLHNLLSVNNHKVPTQIVSCIHRATTSDIITDLQITGITKHHSNSYYQRIWDYINKNISEIDLPDVVTGYTHRGPWKIITLFDKSTGIIYSIMREGRFAELARKLPSHVHYAQALAESFNADIEPEQMSILDYELNESEVQFSINQILEDLQIPENIIQRHVMILFEAKHEILQSVRACVVTGALEICEFYDLSSLINVNESIIVEEVAGPEAKSNDPTMGLKFRDKANKRRDTSVEIAHRKMTETEEQSS